VKGRVNNVEKVIERVPKGVRELDLTEIEKEGKTYIFKNIKRGKEPERNKERERETFRERGKKEEERERGEKRKRDRER
jgi:hypothetical protein